MYMYPMDSLILKPGHHLTYHKGGHSDALSLTHSGFSQPLSRVDQGSAIALGILLVLIPSAVGWFYGVRIKKNSERDAEQQLWQRGPVSTQRVASVGIGTLRSSSEKKRNARALEATRADSAMSTPETDGWRVSHAKDEETERRWQGTWLQLDSLCQSWQSSGTAGALRPPKNQRLSTHQERSISPLSRAMSSRDESSEPQVPRRASCHKRQSSVRSTVTFIPSRRSSLSHFQYDRRRWDEIAAYGGGTARKNRRFSTLAPILEPEAALQASSFHDINLRECGGRSSI